MLWYSKAIEEKNKANMEKAHLYVYGIFFGYPKCCVTSFVEHFGTTNNASRFDVAQRSGFIPCEKHAQMIRNKECTLESLITNRLCKIPFPNTCDTQYEEVVQIVLSKLKKDA